MPRYLVTLSLGPVQSLIEAARRTRDLWCGSWLLSEAARAAACTLHEAQPGCLIFPSPEHPERELQPRDEPRDEANFANILRAEVALPDAAAAHDLCARAKAAAAERLCVLGEQARGKLKAALRDEVWNAQIGDLLEGFAAWAEIPAGADGYRLASAKVGATLAARKAQAKATLERMQKLLRQAAVSRDDVDRAQAEYEALANQEKAMAAQSSAAGFQSAEIRALMQYSTVTSPLNGVLTRRHVDLGAFVQAGTPLAEVADLKSGFELVAQADESLLGR
ncbi:MAG: hypothetical protein EOM10_17640, partial [Opitutae bacterium]|nr:hypothetical protein [Opitutae bacterium]